MSHFHLGFIVFLYCYSGQIYNDLGFLLPCRKHQRIVKVQSSFDFKGMNSWSIKTSSNTDVILNVPIKVLKTTKITDLSKKLLTIPKFMSKIIPKSFSEAEELKKYHSKKQ